MKPQTIANMTQMQAVQFPCNPKSTSHSAGTSGQLHQLPSQDLNSLTNSLPLPKMWSTHTMALHDLIYARQAKFENKTSQSMKMIMTQLEKSGTRWKPPHLQVVFQPCLGQTNPTVTPVSWKLMMMTLRCLPRLFMISLWRKTSDS